MESAWRVGLYDICIAVCITGDEVFVWLEKIGDKLYRTATGGMYGFGTRELEAFDC